jgi:hypothetical protein
VKNPLRLAVLVGTVTSALSFAATPALAAQAPSAVLAANPGSANHNGRGTGVQKAPDDPDKNVTNNWNTSHDTNRNVTNNRNTSHDTNSSVTNDRNNSHDTNRVVRNDQHLSHDANWNITNDGHTSHDTNRVVRNDLGTSHDINRNVTNDMHTSHDTNFTTNYNVTYDYGTHVLPDIKLGDLPVVGSLLG